MDTIEKTISMIRWKEQKIEVETKQYLEKKIRENKNERIKLLAEAERDKTWKIKAFIFDKCKKDPVFFFNYFLWTFNPRNLENPSMPFYLYNFQKIFIRNIVDWIENKWDIFVEKSRDMWFSWLMMWITLWWFLFHKRNILLGSYKEVMVDKWWDMSSLFEKIRYMIWLLPKWFLFEDLSMTFKSITSVKNNCAITWDVWENFWTWWRQTFVFFDEFALWQYDEMAFRKTKDVTKTRIFWWTPEWKFNIYWKVMTNHPDYKSLNIKKIRLHWTLHPLKDEEWYKEEKEKRTKVGVAKELDISYDDSVTWAVYPDFLTLATFWKYEYNPQLPLYTAWDFWLDTTAIIFYQKDNKTWFIYIIDTIQKIDWNIKKMYAFVLWVPTPWFTYTPEELEFIQWKRWWIYSWHYWDPYNSDNRTVITEDTIRKVLSQVGINLVTSRKNWVKERIRKTTLALSRIHINDSLEDFKTAIIQSRYPQKKEWSQETSEKVKPIHDWNSHYRTALEYWIDNEIIVHKQQEYNSVNSISKYWMEKINKNKWWRKVYNPITWKTTFI